MNRRIARMIGATKSIILKADGVVQAAEQISGMILSRSIVPFAVASIVGRTMDRDQRRHIDEIIRAAGRGAPLDSTHSHHRKIASIIARDLGRARRELKHATYG